MPDRTAVAPPAAAIVAQRLIVSIRQRNV